MKEFLFAVAFGALVAAAAIADVKAFAIQSTPEVPAYRITLDLGGVIGEYLTKYYAIVRGNGHVEIDGICVSACTLVTMLDKDKVCITPRARLGFHSAFTYDNDGNVVFSAPATELLWEEYPEWIRTLLLQRGWDGTTPHPELIWLEYSDLQKMYENCK